VNPFSRFLFCLTAVLLACPPGWCCILPRLHTAKAASTPAPEPVHSCCHPQPPPAEPDSDSDKAPVAVCNCPREEATPPESSVATPDPDAAVLVPPPASETASVSAHAVETAQPHSLSPPLQLLHCIWLC
jgi:hypothetical protein